MDSEFNVPLSLHLLMYEYLIMLIFCTLRVYPPSLFLYCGAGMCPSSKWDHCPTQAETPKMCLSFLPVFFYSKKCLIRRDDDLLFFRLKTILSPESRCPFYDDNYFQRGFVRFLRDSSSFQECRFCFQECPGLKSRVFL